MWFRKKRNDVGTGPGLHTGGARLNEAAAKWIANGIISAQMKLARILSNWERRCTQVQRKIALVLFCGIVSCYLFFSLSSALSVTPEQSKIVIPHVGTLSIPPELPPLPPHNRGDTIKSLLPYDRNE